VSMSKEDDIAREAKDILSGKPRSAAYSQQGGFIRFFIKGTDSKKMEDFGTNVKDYLSSGVKGYENIRIINTVEGDSICVIEVQSSDKFSILKDRWEALSKFAGFPPLEIL